MLNYFYDNHLIRYSEKNNLNWREAITESCQLLLEKKVIDESYITEIIACVEEHGPYIVIVPQVAMPHSSGESQGVFGTGISFTKMQSPVLFDDKTEDKEATLFFTLAAKNTEEHLANITKLSELLMTEGLIEKLVATSSIEDYEQVMREYE